MLRALAPRTVLFGLALACAPAAGCPRSRAGEATAPDATAASSSAPVASGSAPIDSASVSLSPSASTSASVAVVGPTDLDPSLFDGVDICLRDIEDTPGSCGRQFGLVRTPGAKPERYCQLLPRARAALVEARRAMQKVNPDLELLVWSSYRTPGYQQCLWLEQGKKGPKCLPTVCGPRDAAGHALPCRKYDLADPKFAHVFDHCQHVDMHAIDVCAYSRSKAVLDEHGVIDLAKIEDCDASLDPKHVPAPGRYYHPCGCRHPKWTKDIHDPSARTKIFKSGSVGEQLVMMRALRDAGFADNVSNEWWHFAYRDQE